MNRTILAAALLAAAPVPFGEVRAEEVGSAKTFDFVVLGDMPYNIPDDYARFENLIRRVNAVAPDFTLHVGDIKSGGTPCSDENFQRVKDEFAMFTGALVYTPGDNEWTDCHRKNAGGFDPLERLAKVREMFFPDSKSHGQKPMEVERQADAMPAHAVFVENARFVHQGIPFVTLHVVGSNNNFEVRDEKTAAEFFARDAANLAWIADTFAKAKALNAPAAVIALQADMWESVAPDGSLHRQSGFLNLVDAIAKAAADFGKPVLVVHGDGHVLDLNRFQDLAGKPVKNAFRLHVPGAETVEAVRVFVDPENPAVFSFQLVTVPENGTM